MATKRNASANNNTSTPANAAAPTIQLEKDKAVDKPTYTLTEAERIPFHFDYYEEALEARNELKAKVAATKEFLVEAEAVFVGIFDNTEFLLFAKSVPKRFEKEHQWFELIDITGKSFGFVDSEDEEAEDTFALTVQRGNEAFHMPYVELAAPAASNKVACVASQTMSEVLKRWHASVDVREDFDRLVANPALRDEELLKRFDAYLAEFAKSRLKLMK